MPKALSQKGLRFPIPRLERQRAAKADDCFPVAVLTLLLVVHRASNLLAFGAIVKHNTSLLVAAGAIEGGRTNAAVAASMFGCALKVSEDGLVSFFQKGLCVWEL
ncbi:MAG: hypothetical protein EXQ52_08170 [Bryobacterales bacterium]|nr:hypothetical protein [Bryobacterales bacterium]